MAGNEIADRLLALNAGRCPGARRLRDVFANVAAKFFPASHGYPGGSKAVHRQTGWPVGNPEIIMEIPVDSADHGLAGRAAGAGQL